MGKEDHTVGSHPLQSGATSDSEVVVGVDIGSTSTKVAAFELDGRLRGVLSMVTPRSVGRGQGRVERDADDVWDTAAALTRQLVVNNSIDSRRVRAIGFSGYGDGAVLVNSSIQPVGPAIGSTDSRASSVVDQWRRDGTYARIRRETGALPFPGSPLALLRWLLHEDRRRLEDVAAVLSVKDYVRSRAVGELATDPTDFSSWFCDTATRLPEFALSQLDRWELDRSLLPPVRPAEGAAGTLGPESAEQLGLQEGTVVATGLHDTASCLVGVGGLEPGVVAIIAGTFGINIATSPVAVIEPSVASRLGPTEGTWTVRAASSASAVNIDWAASVLRSPDTPGETNPENIGQLVKATLPFDEPRSAPLYLPFLNGPVMGGPDAAALLGLRSWHDARAITYAILEGVAFSHRHGIESLNQHVPVSTAILVGGASRSPAWSTLFAEVLNRELIVPLHDEPGARGAAMCAAVAAGLHASLLEASRIMGSSQSLIRPDAERTGVLNDRYSAYLEHMTAQTSDDEPGRDRS